MPSPMWRMSVTAIAKPTSWLMYPSKLVESCLRTASLVSSLSAEGGTLTWVFARTS